MFERFAHVVARLSVFEEWNVRRGEVARRVNSIERKLLNAMFLVDVADEYPKSLTGHLAANAQEIRAMDAYTDGAMAELHGALDMLASATSTKYSVTNRWGKPYSFAQMFNATNHLGLSPEFS